MQEMQLLSGQQLVAVLGRQCQGTGLFSVGKLGSKSREDGWVLLEDEVISVMVPLSMLVSHAPKHTLGHAIHPGSRTFPCKTSTCLIVCDPKESNQPFYVRTQFNPLLNPLNITLFCSPARA